MSDQSDKLLLAGRSAAPSHESAEGLLTRRSDPRDNRFTLVVLTPAGEHIAQQMSAFTHTLEAQILEGLSEEIRTTIRQGLEQAQKQYAHLLTKVLL